MSSILLLYRPKSDQAVLSWGSWRAGLPLANLTQPRLSRVARSADTALASTRFRVQLPQEQSFKALVLGPMNVTSGYKYRIKSYTDATFATAATATDWIQPFAGSSGGALDLEWENPNFWLGIIPFDDEERGVFLIHIFDAAVQSQYWSFELDDQSNPDGYIDIGRLFMPETWAPSVNYGYDNNGLSFEDNSLSSKTLGGSTDRWRRINPRVFRFGLDFLPESEGFSSGYPFMRAAGYDGEVFVVPDPANVAAIQERSFLGTISRMDGLSQSRFNIVGAGFEVREII